MRSCYSSGRLVTFRRSSGTGRSASSDTDRASLFVPRTSRTLDSQAANVSKSSSLAAIRRPTKNQIRCWIFVNRLGFSSGGHADPRAQEFGIGRDRDHRLGGGLEHKVVNHGLVLVGDVADRRRQLKPSIFRQDAPAPTMTPTSRRERFSSLAHPRNSSLRERLPLTVSSR